MKACRRSRFSSTHSHPRSQIGSGLFGEEKNPLSLLGFEPRIAQLLARSLYRLYYAGCYFSCYCRNSPTRVLIGEKCMMRSFMICTLSRYCVGDEIKDGQ